MGIISRLMEKITGSHGNQPAEKQTDWGVKGLGMIIGLDMGGTHTDIVLLDHQGVVREIKVPTDHDDLFHTVLTGLEQITEGKDINNIRRVVLSTTLTTNAIIQGIAPPVGMIVVSGPGLNPMMLKTNEYYFAVSGSIDHRGREVEPINREEINHIADLMISKGIKQVGVVSKFSTRNPDHEIFIQEILGNRFDKIFLGHLISGNLNFPRRIATTYLNAVVYPIHKDFFTAVQQSLDQKGLKMPIHILKADGGTMSFDSSIEFPGQSLLSGPSASAMGAVLFAADHQDSLVLDIGGTTTDIAVLINRVPVLEPLGIKIGQYHTLIRALKTLSVGIGGDSAVRVKDGQITIGPDRIGPAMAHNGPAPTPTDAIVVLGLETNGDREKSLQGFYPIAQALGVNVKEAASQVFDLACRMILKHAQDLVEEINQKPVYTIHDLQEGYIVRPSQILVLGGPAPVFAKRIKALSNYNVNVVPKWGVANALGAGLARTTCEVTLFADTQRGLAIAPEEEYSEIITKQFSKESAKEKAYQLLKQKNIQKGGSAEDLDFEVIEALEFNMVEGFYTTGRNIRVKVQIKPGLIHGFEHIAHTLAQTS